MHQKLIGYKWEGAASLISFMLALIASHFVRVSMLSVFATPILSLVGFCLGLLYIRTWKPVYRIIMLVVLVGCIIAVIAAAIIPAQMSVR
jgi:hypothetical protein